VTKPTERLACGLQVGHVAMLYGRVPRNVYALKKSFS
jgi:hypothetical protein